MNRPIIFLDVDGVLNSERSCLALGGYPSSLRPETWWRLDRIAIQLINRLATIADADIVLSSVWRRKQGNDALLKEKFGLNIVGVTGYCTSGFRGNEVQAYLDECDVEEYVIIDDSSDFHVDQMSRFVRVDNRNGFDLTNFYDACRILNVNPYEVSGKWCKEEITQEEFKLCL